MYQSAIRFRYQRLNPNLPLMPIIPITLSYDENTFKTIALVDSGSSSTIISTEIALRLNNLRLLLSVIFRNEILYARSLGDLAVEIGYTEEDVRRDFGLE